MIRNLVRMLRILLAVAVIVAAAPVSLVAGGSAVLAWRAGWPPGRLYRAALYCVPMLAVWLAATAVATRSAAQVAAAPYLAWLAMWHRGAAGSYPGAAAVIAPAAIPVGLAAGGLAWSYRIRSMQTGSGGLSPGRSGRLRPAAMAASGAQRPGADRRARRGPADHAQRGPGRRRGDQGRGPPRPADRQHPLRPDALASGGGRHHGHR